MTLGKAIQILSLLFGHIEVKPDLDRDKAIKLGIEALKEVRRNRPLYTFADIHLLSGETTE